MRDRLGREIVYLRLSITERCTLKCVYCRDFEGECPKKKELSADDFVRITKALARLGVRKIRVTGGEPMLRSDLEELISEISLIPGIDEIAMTTNGQHLPSRAQALKAAGLTRLNISIDSLKPDRYRELTGGGEFSAVWTGIMEALEHGLTPLKLNAVLVRGRNDDEVDDFIDLARKYPLDMRFIELMPMGRFGQDETRRVPSEELLAARPYLKPLTPRYVSQPSEDYTGEGFLGRVGFISPMSHKFCGECNRVRVTSDGCLKLCLGQNDEYSLIEALRAGDEELQRLLETLIYDKPTGHNFDSEFVSMRDMSRIGG